MTSTLKIRLLTTSLLFGVAVTSTSALAQEASVPADATDAAAADEVIVVTGSRIARPDLEASSPITFVRAEDIALSGSTNVEQFLNELPQVTPDATGTTNNGTDGGIATINLRDLGANRTLVLVNGRRFVASNNLGWVDVNNIPAPLVERVDIVTGGASAVYGSDAVAGVVNFILKDDFEGAEFGGQYRITEEGDAAIFSTDVTLGANFEDGRGNAVLHASYNKRRSLLAGARAATATALGDFGDDPVDGGLFPLGSSRILGGVILVPDTVLPDGTVAPNGVFFTPDGNPIAYDGSTFNFQPLNYLQTPQERYLISGMAHYDVTDNITAFMEGTYINTRSFQQLAADANDIPEPPAQLLATIANPLFSAGLQDYLATNFDDDGDGIASVPAFRRRMQDVGPRFNEFEHDSWRILAGLRGSLGDSGLNFEAYYSKARTNRTEVLTAYTSDIRIGQALLVEPDPANPGAFRCVDAGARANGCVPINIFGSDVLSPEGAAFISPTALVRRSTEQDIASGVISGSLFDLGAGPVAFAIGAEYRKEQSDNLPDDIVQSGELGPGSNEEPTQGQFNVKEFYGEISVPVFTGLTLEAALRYSDYSTVGGVWTYKAGGQFEPIEGIRFRGLYQRAVRAPNIYELFQGTAAGADDFDDPCAARNSPSAELQAFCIAQGVPASVLPTFAGDPGSQATTFFGGNENLREEKSDTYTFGVVLQPRAIPGFTASVDYYKINVEGAIDDLNAATTGQLCFDSLDLTSEACQNIVRDPVNGIVIGITALRANLALEKREGIDWQVGYQFNLDSFGLDGNGTRVTLQNVGNYSLTNEYQPLEGSAFIDCNGRFGPGCTGLGDFVSPKWRTNTTITLASGDFGWRNQIRVIGPIRNTQEGAFIKKIKTQAYWDTVFNWSASENFDFTLGIDNVLDKGIPILADAGPDGNTDASLFDVFGRTYFVGGRLRF
jgi:iron complex outermembrane receptor protein